MVVSFVHSQGIFCAAWFSTDVTGMGDPGNVPCLNVADYMFLPRPFLSKYLALQVAEKIYLASQDALEVMCVTEWTFSDLTDVTLVSDDTN